MARRSSSASRKSPRRRKSTTSKTVSVRSYRICKTRTCSGKGKKVSCKEEYKFKPAGKPRRVDKTTAKLMATRLVPMLTFMAAESCAHGIFPSALGTELAHTLEDITNKVRLRRLNRESPVRRRRFMFFDNENMYVREPLGYYNGVFV